MIGGPIMSIPRNLRLEFSFVVKFQVQKSRRFNPHVLGGNSEKQKTKTRGNIENVLLNREREVGCKHVSDGGGAIFSSVLPQHELHWSFVIEVRNWRKLSTRNGYPLSVKDLL